jgi:Fe-S cluster biogenesis protein NfuA
MSDFTDRAQQAFKKCLPAMTADGGGAGIQVDDQERTITLEFAGTCIFCPSQRQSAKALVQRMRDSIPDASIIRVVSPMRKTADESIAVG